MALTHRGIHSSFSAVPSSTSLSYASASSTVLGKSSAAAALGCRYAGMTSLSYSYPDAYSQSSSFSTSPRQQQQHHHHHYQQQQQQQYPITRPRSSSFYRRAPPSTSSPSYRRTHLASLALAPPTGPITYDPFNEPESELTHVTLPSPRLMHNRKTTTTTTNTQTVGSHPTASSASHRTFIASTSPASSSSSLPPADDRIRHSKLIAGILLNRIHLVGKPMRRCLPLPAEAGPKPYVRSRLSSSTVAIEC